jgi:hypothetical protein
VERIVTDRRGAAWMARLTQQASDERPSKGVVYQLARRDVVQGHLMIVSPSQDGIAGQVGELMMRAKPNIGYDPVAVPAPVSLTGLGAIGRDTEIHFPVATPPQGLDQPADIKSAGVRVQPTKARLSQLLHCSYRSNGPDCDRGLGSKGEVGVALRC